jgi:hypothetical protein
MNPDLVGSSVPLSGPDSGKAFPDLTFLLLENATRFVQKSYQIVIKLIQPCFNRKSLNISSAAQCVGVVTLKLYILYLLGL